jgi:hypothetical protein
VDEYVEDDAVLVDRPPQPVLIAADRDHDFIQAPICDQAAANAY